VVKVKVCEAAVVTAEGAATTGLVHQDPLHLLVPTGYRLADAPLAALPWPCPYVERELRETMAHAFAELDRPAAPS
jgi:hypothetical protein